MCSIATEKKHSHLEKSLGAGSPEVVGSCLATWKDLEFDKSYGKWTLFSFGLVLGKKCSSKALATFLPPGGAWNKSSKEESRDARKGVLREQFQLLVAPVAKATPPLPAPPPGEFALRFLSLTTKQILTDSSLHRRYKLFSKAFKSLDNKALLLIY